VASCICSSHGNSVLVDLVHKSLSVEKCWTAEMLSQIVLALSFTISVGEYPLKWLCQWENIISLIYLQYGSTLGTLNWKLKVVLMIIVTKQSSERDLSAYNLGDVSTLSAATHWILDLAAISPALDREWKVTLLQVGLDIFRQLLLVSPSYHIQFILISKWQFIVGKLSDGYRLYLISVLKYLLL
jgi:hypothetical protein